MLPLGHIHGLGELPYLLSLDPGGTTGWAVYNPLIGDVQCGQLGPDKHHLELATFINDLFIETMDENKVLQIICESFEFRNSVNKDKIELISREYIGVVELFSQQFSIPVEYQMASHAKTFIGDVKLKRMGWYDETVGLTHTRDALRHLLRYMVVNKRVREPITNKWFQR